MSLKLLRSSSGGNIVTRSDEENVLCLVSCRSSSLLWTIIFLGSSLEVAVTFFRLELLELFGTWLNDRLKIEAFTVPGLLLGVKDFDLSLLALGGLTGSGEAENSFERGRSLREMFFFSEAPGLGARTSGPGHVTSGARVPVLMV